MIIDPIGDMFTRIRNALSNKIETVEMPASKSKEAILRVFKKEGLIEDFQSKAKKGQAPTITVKLRYEGNQPAIRHLERISKPGLRVYTQSHRIPRVLSGLGLVIVSTPQGVMTGKEAKRKGIGGEIIGRIW